MKLPVMKQGLSPLTVQPAEMLQFHNLGPAFILQIVSVGSHRARVLTHHLRNVAPESRESWQQPRPTATGTLVGSAQSRCTGYTYQHHHTG